jgi:hypothetical protein
MMQNFDPAAEGEVDEAIRAVEPALLPGQNLANDEERDQAMVAEAPLNRIAAPAQPTQEEYERHQLTHLPHAPWCLHCQRVKSRENKHQRRDEDGERAQNVLHFDYCFFADVVDVMEATVDLTQKPHAVLVGYDSDSGSMIGVQVKCKGKGDAYAVGAVRNWIRSLGITSGVLQADGEESIQAFLREVSKGVEIPLVQRVSALGDKQSNGAAESAVGVLKRQIRVICSQLNVAYEIVLGPRSWIFPWIVRHCGWTISRFVPRGPQKRSGYALRHGCAHTGQVLAFGECCIGKELLADKNKKGAWHTGVCCWQVRERLFPLGDPAWSDSVQNGSQVGGVQAVGQERALGRGRHALELAQGGCGSTRR